MEMGGLDPVWTGCSGRHSVGFYGNYCAGMIGGVIVQNRSEFWCHLLVASFAVGFVLGYGVAAYITITLSK